MTHQRSIRTPPFDLLVLAILLAFLASCGLRGGTPTPAPTPPPADNSTPSAVETPARPTPTAHPSPAPSATPAGRVILAAGSEPDAGVWQPLEPALAALAAGSGWSYEKRVPWEGTELPPETMVFVALPPLEAVDALVEGSPQVQFVAIGFDALPPAPNLSLIGPQGPRSDHLAFIAGYLAAVITPDWRVGVISATDTPAGRAASLAFRNGARFFCGLCQPLVPPFERYPLAAEVDPGAGPEAYQAAAEVLLDAGVTTLYLPPEAMDPELISYLAQTDSILIGTGAPPEKLRTRWAASINPRPELALEALWPAITGGEGGAVVPIPLAIEEVNPELLSPGRQRLVDETIDALLTGSIDTGVDLQTNE